MFEDRQPDYPPGTKHVGRDLDGNFNLPEGVNLSGELAESQLAGRLTQVALGENGEIIGYTEVLPGPGDNSPSWFIEACRRNFEILAEQDT